MENNGTKLRIFCQTACGNDKIWAMTNDTYNVATELMNNFPNYRSEADVHIKLRNTRRCDGEML